jgi:hypothetical protein
MFSLQSGPKFRKACARIACDPTLMPSILLLSVSMDFEVGCASTRDHTRKKIYMLAIPGSRPG